MGGLFAILMAVGCSSSPAEPAPASSADEPTTGVPGKVTDLIVTDSSGTSVVLAFTEVDDGYGLPADYSVRTHVGPMEWGSAEEVTQGTCAAPLQGRSVGSPISCTVENLQPDTPYTFQVAAFRGTFQAGAVYGELSNVVPDMGDGPEPEPEAPTSGSASYPNEPAGLSTIASVDFTNEINAQTGACTEHSDAWKRSNTEYIADSSAPTGDGSVFRGKFPSGMRDGISPWRFDCWGPGMNASGEYDYEELYVTYWLKVEGTDYENQTVGTKTHYIAYGSTGRQNHSAPFLDGTFQDQTVVSRMTYAPYVYEMRDDGSDAGGGAVRRTPNITGHSKKVEVGGWTQIELYYRANDIGPTTDNGILRVWIDGTLTHEETGIRYRSDLNPLGFYHFQFTPVYGGNSGDVRTRDDFWRLDQVYISAR